MFALTLLVWINVAFASASNEIDSLKQAVSIMPENQARAETIHAIAIKYLIDNNLDSAKVYIDELIGLSEKIGYTLGVADGYYLSSRLYHRKEEFPAATEPIKKCIELTEPYNDSLRLAKAYHSYGLNLVKLGKGDTAIIYLKKSHVFFSEIQDNKFTIAVMNDIGNLYQNMANYDSASYYYMGASRICEEYGFENYLGSIYNNVGRTLNRLGNVDDALRYYRMSLEINRKFNKMQDVALNLSNLASTYLENGMIDTAEVLLLEALEIYQEYGTQNRLADIYNNLGEVNEARKKPKEALVYYKQALVIYKENQYAEGMTIAFKNMGDVYSQMGMYRQAREVLDSSLAIAFSAGHDINRRDIYRAMALNYHLAGENASAYEYQLKFTDLHDSIFDLEKTEMINKLKLQYEREKDQTQILELENKNLSMELDLRKKTSQRNAILSAGVGILALAVFLILYFRQRARKDKIIAEQKIIQLEEEKKLMAARLIVEGQEEERKRIATELHDGLGVLLSATKMQFTSIRDKSPENKELIDRATQLLEQASGDVRKISHNMMPGSLTKLGLYEAAEDLIETINDTEDISAQFEHTGDEERLPENKEIMLYRIIQELVNNTLKHAQARNINLKLEKTDSQFKIIYSDDGKGFDVKERLGSEIATMGLKSIHSRVNFLNGELEIISEPGQGTAFFITILA